jgi:hypothetical protein
MNVRPVIDTVSERRTRPPDLFIHSNKTEWFTHQTEVSPTYWTFHGKSRKIYYPKHIANSPIAQNFTIIPEIIQEKIKYAKSPTNEQFTLSNSIPDIKYKNKHISLPSNRKKVHKKKQIKSNNSSSNRVINSKSSSTTTNRHLNISMNIKQKSHNIIVIIINLISKIFRKCNILDTNVKLVC